MPNKDPFAGILAPAAGAAPEVLEEPTMPPEEPTAPSEGPNKPPVDRLLSVTDTDYTDPLAEQTAVPARNVDPYAGWLAPAVPEATGSDFFTGAAKRAAGASFQAGGMVAGAMVGGRALAPFGPLATTVGVVGGGLVGGFAGDLATEPFGLPKDIEDLPETQRAGGAFGEVLGGSAAFMAAPYSLAYQNFRFADTFAGKWLNKVIDTAREYPVYYGAIETANSFSSGLWGAVSETLWPGKTGRRVGMEIAGGFLNPAQLAGPSVNAIKNGFSFLTKWTPQGRLNRMGELLRDAVTASRDKHWTSDQLTGALDELFKDPEFAAFKSTAGTLLNDAPLADLEANLAEQVSAFGETRIQAALADLNRVKNLIIALKGTGHPEALAKAAELRNNYFQDLLDLDQRRMTAEAVAAAKKMSPEELKIRPIVSVEMADVVDRSIQRARKVEEAMWNAIPEETRQQRGDWKAAFRQQSSLIGPIETDKVRASLPFADKLAEVKRSLLLLDAVDAGLDILEDGTKITAKAVQKAEKAVSVDALIYLRSEALSYMRDAARATDDAASRRAREWGLMADAFLRALTDSDAATRTTTFSRFAPGGRITGRTMEVTQRRGAGGQLVPLGQTTEFDDARAFSKALNDTYQRTFVGTLEDMGPHGERLPAELLAKQAMASMDEAAAFRLKALEDATAFLSSQRGVTGDMAELAQADTKTMRDLQERVIRATLDATIKGDGTINRETLFNLSKRYGALLDRFPAVKESIQEALDSDEALTARAKHWKGLTQFLEDHTSISKVLGVESPMDAVRGALRSDRPLETLNSLANLATEARNSESAIRGLRAAIWDDVIRSSKVADEKISMRDMVSALVDPIHGDPANPSLIDWMTQRGIMPPEARTLLDKYISAAENISQAIATRPTHDFPLDLPNFAIDFLIRVSAVTVGTTFSRTADAGHSLMVAQRISAASREFLETIPAKKVRELMIKALRGDPMEGTGGEYSKPFGLLKWALEPVSSAQVAKTKVMQLHAFMVQAGLLGERTDIDDVKSYLRKTFSAHP